MSGGATAGLRRLASDMASWRRRRALRGRDTAIALRRVEATRSVFVHVPKCGGKTVIRDIYGLSEHQWFGHAPACYYLALLGPSRFGRFFKFAVVRDPVHRCLSGFRFYAAGGFGLHGDRAMAERLAGMDFDRFVRDGALEEAIGTDVVFRPQARFVFLEDGRLGVDRLCPFETFDAALAGLPGGLARSAARSRVNASPGARPEIAPATAARIRALYSEDYRLFGGLGPLAPLWAAGEEGS